MGPEDVGGEISSRDMFGRGIISEIRPVTCSIYQIWWEGGKYRHLFILSF